MGKTNRFRRLKELGQMTAKVKQQRFDEALVGNGVCAALSMQWLRQNGALAAPNIESIAKIQRVFDSTVTAKGTIKAVQILAEAMNLRFTAPTLYCPADQQPSQFWSAQGYGASFSDQIVAFARSLRAGLEPNPMRAAFLSVKLVAVSVDGIPRETLLKYAAEQKSTETPLLDLGHAIALIVVEQGIMLCDANCGIYQIKWDSAKPFFDQYQASYVNFGNKVDEEHIIIFDPQLCGIFQIGARE
jgi:hypothetical protein